MINEPTPLFSQPLKKDLDYHSLMAIASKILKNVPVLRKLIETFYAILFAITISALVGLILSLPVMLLWNYVFGDLYKITVFQAWALNVLAGILFSQRSSSK